MFYIIMQKNNIQADYSSVIACFREARTGMTKGRVTNRRVMISESYVRTTPKPRPLSPMTTPNFVTLPTFPWTNMRELCLT
jgi:hypothetical protein